MGWTVTCVISPSTSNSSSSASYTITSPSEKHDTNQHTKTNGRKTWLNFEKYLYKASKWNERGLAEASRWNWTCLCSILVWTVKKTDPKISCCIRISSNWNEHLTQASSWNWTYLCFILVWTLTKLTPKNHAALSSHGQCSSNRDYTIST
jgi:hypothetical protein